MPKQKPSGATMPIGNPNWGKGVSGNPRGRPRKDLCITSLLKEELDKIPLGEKHNRTWRQLLVLAWLTGAMKNAVLLKELLDRVDGKVAQPLEVSGKGGKDLSITFQIGKGYQEQANGDSDKGS